MNSINCRNEGFCCALINARSVGNKSSQVLDLIMENNLDILVITEMWLFSGEQAKLNMITPEGYISFSKPRDERKGGGIAIICQNELKCETKNSSFHATSFKFLHLGITINNKYFSLYTIYRLEPNVEKMSVFFDEFATYLENWTLVSHDVLILRDFNIHIDLPNDSKTLTLLEIFNLVQHAVAPTHESGHIIGLIISHPNDFVYNVVVNEYFSDHKTVSFTLRAIKAPSKSETVTSRNFRSINTQDITTCLANNEISTSISKFNDRVEWYDTVLSALIAKKQNYTYSTYGTMDE